MPDLQTQWMGRASLNMPLMSHGQCCCLLRYRKSPWTASRAGRGRAQACRWQPDAHHMRHSLHMRSSVRRRCAGNDQHPAGGDLTQEQDTNRLTTALNVAIAAEDYGLAARIRDRLSELTDGESERSADWRKLGIPEWLASRAECIGYRFPTGVPLNTIPSATLLFAASASNAIYSYACSAFRRFHGFQSGYAAQCACLLCRSAEEGHQNPEQPQRCRHPGGHRVWEDAVLCDASSWLRAQVAA